MTLNDNKYVVLLFFVLKCDKERKEPQVTSLEVIAWVTNASLVGWTSWFYHEITKYMFCWNHTTVVFGLPSRTNLLNNAVINCLQIIPHNAGYLQLYGIGEGIVWGMTSLAVNQIFSQKANPRPPWAGNTLMPQFSLVSSRTFIVFMPWHKSLNPNILHPKTPILLRCIVLVCCWLTDD